MDPTQEIFYVLRVISSRPYHEGSEYWFRSTAAEILDCLEPWVFDCEDFVIALVQYDNPNSICLNEELELYEIDDLEKAKSKASEIDAKYKINPALASQKDIRVCHDCFIFTEKDYCVKCKGDTEDPGQ